MKTPDLICALVLAFGAWQGYRKGLLVELVATLGFFLALVAGFMLADLVNDLLAGYLSRSPWGLGLAFVLVVVVSLWAVRLLAWWARGALRQTLAGSLDAAFGAAVGMLKMALLLAVLLWAATWLGIKIPKTQTQGTYIFPAIQKLGPWTLGWLKKLLPLFQDIPWKTAFRYE